MKELNFAVEAGSAGKDIAAEKGFKFKEYDAQSDALTAIKTAKADACIIDITMAKAMTGEGTSFEDLGVGTDEGIMLAKEAGFKYISYFKERTPNFIKI
jgi:ABC-type amino acid transport substrate-binding protein